MVNQKIHATYTETYDLNTSINEMSILAIHTPQATSLKKMFKGFFEQYKKFKVLGCNLSMQCASQLSLDPLQIGLDGGVADPRDVLNPILFKACTGESLNILLDQIYNKNLESSPSQHSSIGEHLLSSTDNPIDLYYQMLADDTFRRSHPMRGLEISGLVPMVHKIVSTQPFKWSGVSSGGDSQPRLRANSVLGFGSPSGEDPRSQNNVVNPSVFVSNGITPMPAMDTCVSRVVKTIPNSALDVSVGTTIEQPMGNNNAMWFIDDVPRVYMGVIILPPSILVRLFYRLTIVWHIEFYQFRPAYEVGPVSEALVATADGQHGFDDGAVPSTYFNLYHTAVAEALTKEMSSFDANGLSEITEVNQIAK